MKKFLLIAFIFQLIYLIYCPASAESEDPKLTPAVRKAVYEAQQCMTKKDYGKAEEFLEEYIKKHSQKPHYLVEFTLGNAMALKGKQKEAVSHYKTSADLYSYYAPAWQNMAKIYFDLKQYDQAGDCLLKAYKIDEKKDPSALYNVAVSYIMAEKDKKALSHLEYLTSGEAGTPTTEWLEALLKVCMDLQLKEKAFEAINKLLDKNGNDPRWWKLLGQFHLQQNDYKKAVTALTIHSYLTPINREEIMLIGDICSAIGIPLMAAKYYERALSISGRPGDYKKLASAYIASHKPEKSIDTLSRALKNKPTSRLWFMMGHVFYEEEKYDRAYDAFHKSTRLDPKDGLPHLMMGYCALHIYKNETARRAFQKATHFSKQKKMAKKMLRQLALWKEK